MYKRSITDYRNMPWKNGLGTTCELLIEPADADLNQFDWRISSATIQTHSEFSNFRGVDRSLLVCSGAGLAVRVNQQVSFGLTPLSAVFRFAGEDHIQAELIGDAVVDFNVMTRRSR